MDAPTGEVSYGACDAGYTNGVGCAAPNPNSPAGRPFWTEQDCATNLGSDSTAACGAPGTRTLYVRRALATPLWLLAASAAARAEVAPAAQAAQSRRHHSTSKTRPFTCKVVVGGGDGAGVPGMSPVGCLKTQMSLYWLAAQQGLEAPEAAAEALLCTP